jgi:hypothetical protein
LFLASAVETCMKTPYSYVAIKLSVSGAPCPAWLVARKWDRIAA